MYHLEKENVVAKTLSRKTSPLYTMIIIELELIEEFINLNKDVTISFNNISCNVLVVSNDFLSMIGKHNWVILA